ncbi:MFS transporter [Planctomicrobium sp. SH668]|uniref:MFS transporter n=1 Tax=Planctomicrobium sp. SH668 TaxID=3448126 RepID=UPI003F5C6A96
MESTKSNATIVRLSIMMFLQFFVWGSWYVSVTGFLQSQNMFDLVGAVYTVGPIAAIIAPLFLGVISDRFFASERVLGTLHLIGGALLIAAPSAAQAFTLPSAPEGAGLFYELVLRDLPAYVQPFSLLLLLHMLCYMPTLGLTASLSFRNLNNQEKEFPIVRVLGTLGWIVGGIAVSFLPGKDQSEYQFYLSGGVSLLLGLYSFTLPHTPPELKGKPASVAQILGLDSLSLFKSRSYSVFILSSFLICIPLAGYYSYARSYVDASNAIVNGSATFTMSFGQMSEVFFMLVMPLCFARLGVKWMLVAGMAAWVGRYGLFAAGADEKVLWMILAGIILHGICYDFFFVTGMIYVDKRAPAAIRNQAQSFLVLMTQGLGLGIGAKLFAAHVRMQTGADGAVDWKTVWMYPAIFAAAVMVFFALAFRDDSKDAKVE